MGIEFKCGCRTSGGAFYLCNFHQNLLFDLLEKDK